jgi:hypothetical protein
LEKGKHPEA